MTNEKRQQIERQMVRRLIRVAKAMGWEITKVSDGEESYPIGSERDVMDAVFAVDESWVYFRKLVAGEHGDLYMCRQSVYIVLGNDGWDCIADNSTNERFVSEVMTPMDAYSDKLCEGAF